MDAKTMNGSDKVFLRAEWRKLIMANYIVPPGMLAPYVPAGTELDFFGENCYVSLVGFMFLNTEVLGWRVPWHRDFEEVNLRFYVRRKVNGEWRRAAVFIREIVPKPAITLVANTIYGENYVTRQMKHRWQDDAVLQRVEYSWKPWLTKKWSAIGVAHEPQARAIEAGSEAEFITEHYWGYAKIDARRSMEYEVRHPRWELYGVRDFQLAGALDREYGKAFANVLHAKPASVYLAEGSGIEIIKGRVLCVD